MLLSVNEMKRYSRHLIMPEVGLKGQEKLKAASVLIVGTGGLGSPSSLYLAAAGVGRIGLVDFDKVDYSNLQRQILFTTNDVGRPKIEAAKERLLATNPEIKVETYETRLTSENAMDIFKNYDIIIDGTDNFPTRYLTNDACVLLGKPNVYGSIFRFEGQTSIFDAKRGPCYRCLYPEPPPAGMVPSCSEGGVLGILPGLVGVIQATEAIKLILGEPDVLIGRLLLINALKMKFREVKLRKNEECSLCGKNPTIGKLIDYNQFCGVSPQNQQQAQEHDSLEISVHQLDQMIKSGKKIRIIDVREPHEWEICHLDQAELIPLSEFEQHIKKLKKDEDLIIHCKSGGRSMSALILLRDQFGFTKVKSVAGGITAWAEEIDPSMPTY
jgi:adenylyltransferase/sulfurtransferase